MGTPRRLTLHIKGLPTIQPDAELTAMGRQRRSALYTDGKPTKAAEGFARGQGVAVSALQVISTDKGEYLAVTNRKPAADP